MRATARSPNSDATSQIANGVAIDAKSQVLAAIGKLVDSGKAEWSRAATGEIELRLLSGEVFLLGEVFVTRVA
ncbi:hypothetical protein [Mesorhizobium sp. M0488]|uniref:hypothetical protein n=1 Tax=unclassified Mesorhizobium TaxID=325217 RepID=UPI00333A0538